MADVRRTLGRARVRLGQIRTRVVPRPWPPTLAPGPPTDPEPGERIAAPDYVGIGAARSGSSWIARMVAGHPLVHRQRWGKELHYFDRFYDQPMTEADVAAYHRYFPRGDGQVTGEWTPGYMYQPWARAAIDSAAPGAKILVILRDPIDQYISSINYSAVGGAPRNALMVTRHMAECCYASHLRLWSDLGPDRLLVLQAETCFDDPAGARARVWDHLGLEDYTGEVPSRWRNAGAEQRITLTDDARRAMALYVEPDVLALAAMFDSIDPARWPNFAHLG